MSNTKSQGQQIADRLKRRPMTYGQMQNLRISTSPQKRVLEWLRINTEWRLNKPKRADGLVQWRVVKA